EAIADSTNQFLDSQLDTAKTRLVEQEQRIDQYKVKYSGQLPSQVATNLQVMQNVQLQIQSIVDSKNRDRDRQLLLQDQLADREALTPAAADAAAANATRMGQIRAEIDRLGRTVERKEEEEGRLRKVEA